MWRRSFVESSATIHHLPPLSPYLHSMYLRDGKWHVMSDSYSIPGSRCGQEDSTIKTKQRGSMHGKIKITASLNYLFSKHSTLTLARQIVSVTSLLCVCYDWSYYKLEHNKFCQVKQIRKTEEIFHTCAECRLGWGPVTAGCRLLLPLFSGHWLLTIFCLLTISFNTSHSNNGELCVPLLATVCRWSVDWGPPSPCYTADNIHDISHSLSHTPPHYAPGPGDRES